MSIIIVDENDIRIDKFLVDKLNNISRANIQALIKEGKITVNHKTIKPNYKLSLGEEVSYEVLEKEVSTIEGENLNLDIVYEDEEVIIINKPSGMVVHPAVGNYTGTLVNGLIYHASNLANNGNDFRPGIVHRIDKDTSGLLMVAKTKTAHESLTKQLKEHTVNRLYVAIVHGNILEEDADIDAPIGRDVINRKKMIVTPKNSKLAYTSLHVTKRYQNYTIIECKLKTGRTHQIRVHLKWIGHPLVGDPTYGPRKTIDTHGQALHAKTLGFIHPTSGEYMEFEAPLPPEFKNTIQIIEQENV